MTLSYITMYTVVMVVRLFTLGEVLAEAVVRLPIVGECGVLKLLRPLEVREHEAWCRRSGGGNGQCRESWRQHGCPISVPSPPCPSSPVSSQPLAVVLEVRERSAWHRRSGVGIGHWTMGTMWRELQIVQVHYLCLISVVRYLLTVLSTFSGCAQGWSG